MPFHEVAARDSAFFSQWKKALGDSFSSNRELAYLYFACIDRPEVQKSLERTIGEVRHTKFRANIFLGMGRCPKKSYTAILLKELNQKPPPHVTEALAWSLGQIDPNTAAKNFQNHVGLKSKRYDSVLVTEAMIIALGRTKDKKVFKTLEGVMNDLPRNFDLPILITRDANADRLLGAVVWAIGDLGLQQDHQKLLQEVFDSKSNRASLAAAKTLYQWKKDQDYEQYLGDLYMNPNVVTEIRVYAGKALAEIMGDSLFEKYIPQGGFAPLVRLRVLRSRPPKTRPKELALSLLNETDPALIAEGAISLALTPQKAAEPQIKKELKKDPNPVVRALLYYTWEETGLL